jgi:branched-chain amino acid transport system substrate-binding protein
MVKIGLAAPFEGLDRPLGYEALAGVKLALAERNAAGGVNGYMLELVALNDLSELQEARLQAREFAVDPAVLGVITGWSEETAEAAFPVYRQLGLAVAVPWSVLPEQADAGSGVVLVAADTQLAAQELARSVAESGSTQLVVIGDASVAAPYLAALEALDVHAQLVAPPDVAGAEALDAWTTRLVASRVQSPDTLLLATDGVMAGEVLRALTALNWPGKVFGGVPVGSIHSVTVAGDAASGLTFVSPSPAGKDALHDEAQVKDELGPRAVLAYDAAQVLLDAIELAIRRDGHPSRQGVLETLPQVQRQGLTGNIAFDETGRRRDAPVWLYKIVDREYPGQVLSSR